MILDFRYNSLTSFESFEHSHYCLLMIDHISVAVSFSFHIYSSFFSQFSNESTLNSSKNNKKKDSTHANNLIYTETSVDENFTFKIIKFNCIPWQTISTSHLQSHLQSLLSNGAKRIISKPWNRRPTVIWLKRKLSMQLMVAWSKHFLLITWMLWHALQT